MHGAPVYSHPSPSLARAVRDLRTPLAGRSPQNGSWTATPRADRPLSRPWPGPRPSSQSRPCSGTSTFAYRTLLVLQGFIRSTTCICPCCDTTMLVASACARVHANISNKGGRNRIHRRHVLQVEYVDVGSNMCTSGRSCCLVSRRR